MAWLASDFLLELRRACGIASTSGASPEGLTDPELLPTVDREIQLNLVPMLLRCREEFFVLKQSVSIVSTTTRVRIPARAIAAKVRDIRQTVNGQDRPLTRYEPEEKARLFPSVSGSGSLCGYYLEGEWIVLVGSPATSTLDIYYHCRPGRLTVTAGEFRVITAVDTVNGIVNFSFWDLLLSSQTYDFVRGSSGLSPVSTELSVDLSGGVSTAAVGVSRAALLAVGDYIVFSDKTPVLPLPVEMHSLLLCRSAAAVLRQLGKYDEAAAEAKTADRLEQVVVGILSPRVESQSKTVVGNFHWRRRRTGRW